MSTNYVYGTGRRKTAVARVRLLPGDGGIVVNGKPAAEYFGGATSEGSLVLPFRVTETGKVYTIGDKDAPHLRLKVVVVNTQFVAYPDDSGKFEVDGVPPGSYKVRVWYKDNWLSRDDETINVAAKGKTDVNPKIPAAALTPPAKK